jgi:hypothetical protein
MVFLSCIRTSRLVYGRMQFTHPAIHQPAYMDAWICSFALNLMTGFWIIQNKMLTKHSELYQVFLSCPPKISSHPVVQCNYRRQWSYRTVFSETVPIIENGTCTFDQLPTDVSDCTAGWEGCTLKYVTIRMNPRRSKTYIVDSRQLTRKTISVTSVASFQLNLSIHRSWISAISVILLLTLNAQ